MRMTFAALCILKQPAAHVPPRSLVQRTSQNLARFAAVFWGEAAARGEREVQS